MALVLIEHHRLVLFESDQVADQAIIAVRGVLKLTLLAIDAQRCIGQRWRVRLDGEIRHKSKMTTARG